MDASLWTNKQKNTDRKNGININNICDAHEIVNCYLDNVGVDARNGTAEVVELRVHMKKPKKLVGPESVNGDRKMVFRL